jgi:LmbE family N-acetylglucosaminyl deacetylase
MIKLEATKNGEDMKILVFAAHPDDAEWAVGGSICRYTDAGHSVHVVNMTNNHTARVACAQETNKLLGCTCEFLDFNDLVTEESTPHYLGVRFDPEHLAIVRQKIEEHHPDLVWAHWPVDTHPDHVATGSLVLRATDQIRLAADWHPELWFFAPTVGYQAVCFRPDHFEDITPYVERKKQAMLIYEKVVSIMQYYVTEETAHRYYGYLSGFTYAEAFIKCNFRMGRERYEVADSTAG